jgi:hypothetical protein
VSTIIIDFPADQSAGHVEDFGEGASASFFQNFNAYGGSAQDMTYTKLKRSITLYGTKFDLSTLASFTSEKTAYVTIKADTIYTSQPMSIHYKLQLVARVVAIDHPITMIMTSAFVFSPTPIESWTYSEKLINLADQITLRERRFGLVEILDEGLVNPAMNEVSCEAATIPATAEKVSPWMDMTAINLYYICSRTLLTSGSNRDLTNHISNFSVRILHDLNLVGSQRIFNTAQKFKRLNQQIQISRQVHNVPSYTLNTIMQLSEVLYNSMILYRTNEVAQENQLFLSMGRMQDMSTQFGIVEQQQNLYFDMEMQQLEAIWQDSSTQWNFDFEHRNEIQANMNAAFEAQAQLMFQMQEQEYTEMMAEAQASVVHMEEVVSKYQTQVDRVIEKAKGSMEVQNTLMAKLRENIATTQVEIDNFKRAAEAWAAAQIVKAFLSLIFAFAGAATGDPAAVMDAITSALEVGMEIADMILELQDVFENIEDIQAIIDSIDEMDVGGSVANMNTEFSAALKNAVDMKMKGPMFDNFESKVKLIIYFLIFCICN